jgi:hypothetical protein
MEGWDMENGTLVTSGRGTELSRIDDEWIFSRFHTISMTDGPQSYLRFDKMDLDTDDHVPDTISMRGLSDAWNKVFGSAFDFQPTWGDNSYERGSAKSRMDGNSYIATYEKHPYPGYNLPGWIQGNGPVGMIKSDPFTLVTDRIGLLVGGGAHPDTCFVALVDASDHKLYFSQTGQNNDQMTSYLWNTELLIGTEVYVVVADLFSGEWGNIAVDNIGEHTFSGHEPGTPAEPMVDGPTIWEILENAGFGGTAVDDLPSPAKGRLLNPYPNPFNPVTQLGFILDEPAFMSLGIHDVSGRLVRQLWKGLRAQGESVLIWDGRDDRGQALPSGLYFANMSLEGKRIESRKLVLLK